jgi:hypothetical protein
MDVKLLRSPSPERKSNGPPPPPPPPAPAPKPSASPSAASPFFAPGVTATAPPPSPAPPPPRLAPRPKVPSSASASSGLRQQPESLPQNPVGGDASPYRVSQNTGTDTRLWDEIQRTVGDWGDYTKRAIAHLDANKGQYGDDYGKRRAKLQEHSQLADIFAERVKDGHIHAGSFVAVHREGRVGALMVRRQLADGGVFLDDLWSDPRKAHQITSNDRIQGTDASGTVALAHAVREAHAGGGDLKLIGGNRGARRFYYNAGFGVKARPPGKTFGSPVASYDEHEAVNVDPVRHNAEADPRRQQSTEREMFLAHDRQRAALHKLESGLGKGK